MNHQKTIQCLSKLSGKVSALLILARSPHVVAIAQDIEDSLHDLIDALQADDNDDNYVQCLGYGCTSDKINSAS